MKLSDLAQLERLAEQRNYLLKDLELAETGGLQVRLGRPEDSPLEPLQGSAANAKGIFSVSSPIPEARPVYCDTSMSEAIRSAVVANIRQRIFSVEAQMSALGVYATL